MTLIEQMRRHLSEAKARGVTPDHWEITPEALAELRQTASAAELTGSDAHGEWTLDGVALRETSRTFPGSFHLVPIVPR